MGGLGALYGGLGVARAVQHAMNTAWAVPRNRRPNPIKVRGRGLLLLATVGLGVLRTSVLSALGGGAGAFGAGARVLALGASVVLNAAVFLLAFRVATARRLTLSQIAPGAVVAALTWQLLQSFGASYVGQVVASASTVNGVFAFILGLISFLYPASVAVVLFVEINVVRVDKLHPRALLTPVTDNVELTEADQHTYTRPAQAQRDKSFEDIEVRFRK